MNVVAKFLAFFFLVCSGAICYNYTESVTAVDVLVKTLAQLPIFVLVSVCYAVLWDFLPRRWRWTSVMMTGVLGLYAFVTLAECYLCVFMKTGITPSILAFLFQTNVGESQGFIQAFVVNKGFFLFVGVLLMVMVAVWCVILFLPFRGGVRKLFGYLAAACVAYCLFYFLYFMNPLEPCTSVSRAAAAMVQYRRIVKDDVRVCFDTGITDDEIESPIVVLVVGEAFSKHHSSLYGYEKVTNPCLMELVRSGNLYPFYDVISPFNKTHQMLRELLSVHSVDAPMPWKAYPLWPQIFKEAGYYVSFVSNQVPSSDFASVHEEQDKARKYSFFFLYPEVEDKCFDYRNAMVYRYDEGLFQELDVIDTLGQNWPELTIVHLNGQHIYSANNFPHERFSRFGMADYTFTDLDLDARQLQEVADYDNATLYNDWVVSTIMERYRDKEAVVVYLSDHGEEVHDYRPFLGRTHKRFPTRQELKYQYEIPFMVYMSDAYKEKHPVVVRRVESAVYHRFMSDDLPHMLLGLSGIRTMWYEPQRDLLNPDFNLERERIFGY